jgi:uncharacterized repeat protein (TIGR01451 family)
VTSITNKSPDFPDFTKVAEDLDAGVLLEDDEVEYTLTAKNSGNDAAVNTIWQDVLDSRLELVAASLTSVEAGVAVLTHAAGDDRGEYTGDPHPARSPGARTARPKVATGGR